MPLPSGVTERDLELFTSSQDSAKKFLESENAKSRIPGAKEEGSKAESGSKTPLGPEYGVPSQVSIQSVYPNLVQKVLLSPKLSQVYSTCVLFSGCCASSLIDNPWLLSPVTFGHPDWSLRHFNLVLFALPAGVRPVAQALPLRVLSQVHEVPTDSWAPC